MGYRFHLRPCHWGIILIAITTYYLLPNSFNYHASPPLGGK